jgi:hypothetical protein
MILTDGMTCNDLHGDNRTRTPHYHYEPPKEVVTIGPTPGSILWDVIDTDGSVMCRWSTMAQAEAHADRANAELAALAPEDPKE